MLGRVSNGTDVHTVFQGTVRIMASIDTISQTTNADQAELVAQPAGEVADFCLWSCVADFDEVERRQLPETE